MTLEKEKKRSVMFWKKSHSQNSLGGGSHWSPEGSPTQDGEPEFVEKDINVTSVFGPFIKNYVSNLSHNKSPTKLPYPPNFYYPASSLQHQMNLQMAHVDILTGASALPTPLERFIAVLKYTLTTCHLTKFPYKPIIAFLGETDQSFVNLTDGTNTSTTYYVGEQLEREPPTCAYHIANPSRGMAHWGHVALEPKFKQAHVHVSFVGQRKTVLSALDGSWRETYVGDVPDLNIRLLRMHTELGGNVTLSCAETGYSASIQFKDKPLFGGVKNAVSGNVTLNGRELYLIDGTWDGVTYLIDSATKEKFEFMNRNTLTKLKVESYPLDQQPATSGEKNWGVLIDCLHRQDFEQAKVVKAQIDAEHHERLAKFEINPYVPAFFHKTATGAWELKDPNLFTKVGMPTM